MVEIKQKTAQNAIQPKANCLESSLKKVRSDGGQVSLEARPWLGSVVPVGSGVFCRARTTMTSLSVTQSVRGYLGNEFINSLIRE